jgi:SAM-dependent methyltransferase
MLEDIVGGLGPVPVYGQYPRGLIDRLLPHLGCERREILHICSGCLPRGEGIRVDIRPDARPDVVADATELPFADDTFAAAMCDPPYSADYARRLYGVKYPRPSHVLREAVRVVRPGGIVAFVHYIQPSPPKGSTFVKGWAASTGFNMPIRAVSLYQKHHPRLGGFQ